MKRVSQGERKLSLESDNRTARPEEPPSSGGVSKGARWRKSTVSSPESADALAAGQQQEAEPKELTELPSSYGQTRLTLMGIDPFWIHAYWEVTPHDHEAVMAQLGSERTSAHWVLRFYDVTSIDFDGTNAHGYFDQPVDLAANNWYVNLWSSAKICCADIGARAPSGRFEPACRSNFVHTPRADESPHYRPEWLHVEALFDKVERVTLSPPSEPPVTAADSPALAQTAPPISDESALQMVSETVDEREPHPSRRSQNPSTRRSAPAQEGPPQGERILSFENNNRTARPEEPPPEERSVSKGSGGPSTGLRTGVSKPALSDVEGGARWRKSTVSPPDASAGTRPGTAWHEVRGRSSPTLSSFGGGSWAPSGRVAVDLKSNAEVNISGHAQPNQAVQVDGQWLEVNSNRTFSGRPGTPVRK